MTILIKGYEIAIDLHNHLMATIDKPESLRIGDNFIVPETHGAGKAAAAINIDNLPVTGVSETETFLVGFVIEKNGNGSAVYAVSRDYDEFAKIKKLSTEIQEPLVMHEYIKSPVVFAEGHSLIYHQSTIYNYFTQAYLLRHDLETAINLIKKTHPHLFRKWVILDVRDIVMWLNGQVAELKYKPMPKPQPKTIYVDIQPLFKQVTKPPTALNVEIVQTGSSILHNDSNTID